MQQTSVSGVSPGSGRPESTKRVSRLQVRDFSRSLGQPLAVQVPNNVPTTCLLQSAGLRMTRIRSKPGRCDSHAGFETVEER